MCSGAPDPGLAWALGRRSSGSSHSGDGGTVQKVATKEKARPAGSISETPPKGGMMWLGEDDSGRDCLFSDANVIPEDLKQVAMRACNTGIWMGCSKWLDSGESLIVNEKSGNFQTSVVLPSEAGRNEGLRAAAEGSNHKQRLRCLALGLVINAALQGNISDVTLKGWHDQMPRIVADIRDSGRSPPAASDAGLPSAERARSRSRGAGAPVASRTHVHSSPPRRSYHSDSEFHHQGRERPRALLDHLSDRREKERLEEKLEGLEIALSQERRRRETLRADLAETCAVVDDERRLVRKERQANYDLESSVAKARKRADDAEAELSRLVRDHEEALTIHMKKNAALEKNSTNLQAYSKELEESRQKAIRERDEAIARVSVLEEKNKELGSEIERLQSGA